MDGKKIEEGVKLLLEGMGEDINREGLKDTPARVARAFQEVFAGYGDDAKKHLSVTFESKGEGVILEKDIPVYSVCEHHLLPFFGKAHVAYLPSGRVTGLSKIARTVEVYANIGGTDELELASDQDAEVYARRLQLQERLTEQIARAIEENLSARGVMVMIEAEHTCMTMRGIKKTGSRTVTCTCLGEFENNEELRARVTEMIKW